MNFVIHWNETSNTIKGETDQQPRLDAWDKRSDLVLWEDLLGSYMPRTLVNKLLHELASLILTTVLKIYGIIVLIIQKEIEELNLKKLYSWDVN